ncbi:MAG: HEAT repeat domain-containing protein, partial [Planctomycetaceae bacterium]|nr:HEAT repeat domain-containing protein [Planctomycetaceae bacterium]
GRLWVVEMGDYPNGDDGAETGGGRIRVLEDTDGDGRYDQAVTFADQLPFPNGLAFWRGGVIVTAAPDILFLADTDGDLKADQRCVLYSGFVPGNQQHRVNGLRWGLDGWLYLANGDSGGDVVCENTVLPDHGASPATPVNRSPVRINGRDLRIQPDSGGLDPVSGQTQFGRERDDFGNWFGNNNSNPIWFYVLQDEVIRRNPHASVSSLRTEVAAVPGAAPVFPASQTLARFNDFGAANRFTSACSTMIYRDHLLGEEFYGNAFTSESVHNLVSRLVLRRDGVSFHGQRADSEQMSEFLASEDNWTRPTMIRTGPDGALYVADMYRQVIEHPTWIPAEYQRKLDLRAGSQLGRIYRIVPDSGCCGSLPGDVVAAAPENKAPVAELRGYLADDEQTVSSETLLSRLASPNGWWRDTAQRILLHRQEQLSSDQLNGLLTDDDPAVRVQALWLLASSPSAGSSDLQSVVVQACSDPHPEVRRHAVWILQSVDAATAAELTNLLKTLAGDSDPSVRMQVAAVSDRLPPQAAADILATVLTRDADDSWLTATALSSLHADTVGPVLQQIVDSTGGAADGELLTRVIRQAIAFGQTDDVQSPLIRLMQSVDRGATSTSQWNGLTSAMESIFKDRGIQQSLQNLSAWQIAMERAGIEATQVAADEQLASDVRVAAIRFLAAGGTIPEPQQLPLLAMLQPGTAPDLQQAVVDSLIRVGGPSAVTQILMRWKSFSPAVRLTATTALLSGRNGTERLLDAIEQGDLSVTDLDTASRERLLNHPAEALRARAGTVLQVGPGSAQRADLVIEWLQRTETLTGDVAAGKAVFEKRCSQCHRLQELGRSIGADLAALKDRSREALVTAILDPNRAVEAKFLSYTAVTKAGEIVTGMLLSESGNSVTLLSTDGKEHVIGRDEIEELVASSRSLMPDGFEKELSEQNLADVITFLQASGVPWKQFANNSPIVLVPDENGVLTLPATAAEIYGPSLIFEQQYRNLGWWTSTDDYAVWTVEVPQSGHWTVEVDYACDQGAAGNMLRLSTGTRLLSARVPGTGTWSEYRTWKAGTIDLARGRRQLIMTAAEPPSTALIDLRTIRLIPPEQR